MTTATTLDRFTGLFHLPLSFGLQHGGELLGAQLGFELWGVDDGPGRAPSATTALVSAWWGRPTLAPSPMNAVTRLPMATMMHVRPSHAASTSAARRARCLR
jgi:hypothetical protein